MKMITTISCIIYIFFMSFNQDLTIEATFDGYEEEVYYFTVNDEESYEFQDIEESILKKYDLKSDKFIGENFKITYKIVSEIDEFEDEYSTYIITNLELIK